MPYDYRAIDTQFRLTLDVVFGGLGERRQNEQTTLTGQHLR